MNFKNLTLNQFLSIFGQKYPNCFLIKTNISFVRHMKIPKMIKCIFQEKLWELLDLQTLNCLKSFNKIFLFYFYLFYENCFYK